MKSTLFNMVLVLLTITLLASAGVGVVHMITQEPIAEAQANTTREALQQVLPAFDRTTDEDLTIDNLPVTIHTATQSERVVGYAVESMTKSGFSGVVRLMVGFAPDGEVVNIRVLEQAETPGLGTKMTEEGNPLQSSFLGKNPAQMKLSVKKDGGDVDALTAATISSRAYVDAVARAYKAYCEKVGIESVNTSTGASAQTDGASGASNTDHAPKAEGGIYKSDDGRSGSEQTSERSRENRGDKGNRENRADRNAETTDQEGGSSE